MQYWVKSQSRNYFKINFNFDVVQCTDNKFLAKCEPFKYRICSSHDSESIFGWACLCISKQLYFMYRVHLRGRLVRQHSRLSESQFGENHTVQKSSSFKIIIKIALAPLVLTLATTCIYMLHFARFMSFSPREPCMYLIYQIEC